MDLAYGHSWIKLHHFRLFSYECVLFVYQQLLINYVSIFVTQHEKIEMLYAHKISHFLDFEVLKLYIALKSLLCAVLVAKTSLINYVRHKVLNYIIVLA